MRLHRRFGIAAVAAVLTTAAIVLGARHFGSGALHTTAAPVTHASPTPGPLYHQPHTASDISLDPTTSTPFVPTGATPDDLLDANISFTTPQNLNPPVTYTMAYQDMAACSINASRSLSNAGYTHVTLGDMGYSADVWAFATIPGTYLLADWQFWFIDANDGSCRGFGSGSNPDAGVGHPPQPMPRVSAPRVPCVNGDPDVTLTPPACPT